MASYIRTPTPETEGGVGSVFTDIVVSNQKDLNLAEEGHLSPDHVRRIELSGVLVDTGASVLCLPESLIEQLGLPLKERVVANTAGGPLETRVYAQAYLEIGERWTVVECLALPEGTRPLVGVIPLELMGLEPDLVRHVLRVLPKDSKDSYIFAY